MKKETKSVVARLLAIVLVFSSFCQIGWTKTAFAAGPSFVSIAENNTNLKKYDKFELTVNFNASYDNPFRAEVNSKIFRNADQTSTGSGVALDGFFTTPSGKIYQVPGFYMVDYTKTGVSSMGDDLLAVNSAGKWLVRFSPKESGTYKYYLQLVDKTGTIKSETKTFNVTSDTNPLWPHGSIVKNPDNPDYLQYEDGTPYTQFGITGGIGPDAYADFSQNGGNFVRTWLTNGSASSIFRNTLNPWRSDSSKKYSADAAHDGKLSYKTTSTNLASGKYLLDQGSIGAAANACYVGSAWVKTGSDFSGAFKLQSGGGGKKVSSSTISAANLPWTKISFTPIRSSSMNALNFQMITTAVTNGTVWLDDTALYETTVDASGNCTSTPKYQSNQYSMIWDPSFESDHVNGDPAHLNMVNLARFEESIASAEKNNIIVMPCIFDHRVWGNSADNHSNWAPFFKYDSPGTDPTTGKPLPAPYSFWTDSFSREQINNVLRYLIARFSYSPALGIWEIGNEMSPYKTSVDQNIGVKTVSDYLHANDPYHHLVTNSYWFNPDPEVEASNGTDITTVHYYINDDSRNPTTRPCESDEYMWAIDRNQWSSNLFSTMNGQQKPWLSGEFGLMGDRIDATGTKRGADLSRWDDPGNLTWQDTVTRHDTKGIFFHNAVWASLTANAFKSTVSNWWGDPFKTWNYQTLYSAPSKFASQIPFFDDKSLRLSTYTSTDKTPSGSSILNGGLKINSSNSNVRALGRIKTDTAYLWIQNKNNTWGNVIKDNQTISNVSSSLTIPGFTPNTTLPVKFFDSYTGTVLTNSSIKTDAAGNLTLSVALTTDRPDTAVIIGNNYKNPVVLTQSVSIPGGGTTAHAGDTINYSLKAENKTDIAQVINLTDPIDTTLVNFVTADHNGVVNTNDPAYPGKSVITWSNLSIAPKTTETISFSLVVRTPTNSSLITNITATSGKVYKIGQFKPGNPIYIDRDYTIKTMPSELIGIDGIKTSNDDKRNTNTNFLSFKLLSDAYVYIGYDQRITTIPTGLKGWEDTKQTMTDNEKVPTTFRIYRKAFTAGQVTLGGNYGKLSSSMYLVMARPISKEGLITNLKAASGKTYLVSKSSIGSTVYIDRTYTIKSVDPGIPAGAYWIKTANDDKRIVSTNFLSFNLTDPATVLVAVDRRILVTPPWLKDWTKTTMTVTTNDLNGPLTYNVYKKKFAAGPVVLGGNSGTSSDCMYLVIVGSGI